MYGISVSEVAVDPGMYTIWYHMVSGNDTRSVPFLYLPCQTTFQGGSRMKVMSSLLVYLIVQECSSVSYERHQGNEYFMLKISGDIGVS